MGVVLTTYKSWEPILQVGGIWGSQILKHSLAVQSYETSQGASSLPLIVTFGYDWQTLPIISGFNPIQRNRSQNRIISLNVKTRTLKTN